jgi:hypothetical protein
MKLSLCLIKHHAMKTYEDVEAQCGLTKILSQNLPGERITSTVTEIQTPQQCHYTACFLPIEVC